MKKIEMSNINLPPFYIGQRVVRLCPHNLNYVTKGTQYEVTSIMESPCKCSHWLITVGVANPQGRSICTICKRIHEYHGEMRFQATSFAPIESQFAEITFKECIAIESPVTCMQ